MFCYGGSMSDERLAVQRVRPSYVQVAEQLRDLIIRGELPPDYRLPPEGEVGTMFGVSRSTVREALRLLAAEGLIVTKRGVSGGSFVAHPDPERIENLLGITMNLLSGTDRLLLDELLEARRLIEGPAAALAARRRTADQLELIQDLSSGPGSDPVGRSDGFHIVVLRAAHNRLLQAMTRPLFAATLARYQEVGQMPWDRVFEEHRRIAVAIAAGDEQAAHEEMTAHIGALHDEYLADSDDVTDAAH
jgi:GntR family transcriptional regulator, transcriptional repressor for pyruvate dehydrogenase complex